MFKHILMPTDGSEHSEQAVKRGIELAKLCNAKVTGIHVVPEYHMLLASEGAFDIGTEERIQEETQQNALRFLEFVRATAATANVPCETVVATNAHPYDAIVNTANERGCDLIVMTARYRKSLVKVLMGDQATRVLHRASIPVLTFRGIMSSDHPDRDRAVPRATAKV